jgi:hypothetical protein
VVYRHTAVAVSTHGKCSPDMCCRSCSQEQQAADLLCSNGICICQRQLVILYTCQVLCCGAGLPQQQLQAASAAAAAVAVVVCGVH